MPWEEDGNCGGMVTGIACTILLVLADALRLAVIAALLAGSHCLLTHGLASGGAKLVAAVVTGARLGGGLALLAPVLARVTRGMAPERSEWDEPVLQE